MSDETGPMSHGLSTKNKGIIARLLRDGYGVEDIAHKLRLNVHDLRSLINRWREAGWLRMIFGHEKDPQREFRFRKAYRIMTGRNWT